MFEKRAQHPYWVWESMIRTPEMLELCLAEPIRDCVENTADRLAELTRHRAFCAGTGSSSYASIVHACAFRDLAGLSASWHVTSELGAYPPTDLGPGSALILASHSGRTIGDVEVVELARQRGAYTIAVTDIPDSPLARAADDTLIGPGGPKAELPATRTYVAAMFRVIQLAAGLARRLDRLDTTEMFEERLRALPATMRLFLDRFASQAADYAARLAGVQRYFVIGAGPNMSTASEGALVLLQSTSAGAQAFHVEEMLHGPIQGLGPGMCIVAIAAPGPLQRRILRSAQAYRIIGATVLTIAPEGTSELGDAQVGIAMPREIPELLTPLLYILPFWLIGYESALAAGRDPDNLSRDKPEFKRAFRLLMAGDPRFDKRAATT